MERSPQLGLVLLDGGRASDDLAEGSPARGELHVVRGSSGAEAADRIAEAVEAARRVRREIEERIAAALDEILRARAPEPAPR
jgi:hypothetical protein